MDYGFIILGVLSAAVLVSWLVLGSKFAEDDAASLPKKAVEPKVVLSEADLKKKTKAQLLEVAETVGIEVDKKLTKAKIIAELVK